jgi:hypothetical protein
LPRFSTIGPAYPKALVFFESPSRPNDSGKTAPLESSKEPGIAPCGTRLAACSFAELGNATRSGDGVIMYVNEIIRLAAPVALLVLLGACSPEVGSDEWCSDMRQKPKGDWTANEAADFAKHCLLG